MAEQFQDLAFPLAGRSDGFAKGNQDPATCSEAQNMRATDPETGRIRGAQRGGLKKLISSQAASTKVQWLGEVAYQKDLTDFTQRSGEQGASEKEVTTPGAGTVAAVATDRLGNVYALDVQASAIAIYTAELEYVDSIALPTSNITDIARVIAVGDNDQVYCAGGLDRDVDQGVLWAFGKENDRWTLKYETFFEGSVVAMDYRNGMLAVGVQNSETVPASAEVFYYNAISETLLLAWHRNVPYPIGDVALDSISNVFLTCPWDKNRGFDDYGYSTRSIDWTPYDLTNSDERIYFWVSADSLEGKSERDGIWTLPDIRNRSDLWTGITDLVRDVTPRPLRHKYPKKYKKDYEFAYNPDTGFLERKVTEQSPFFDRPEYSEDMFGALPGLRFRSNDMMWSSWNTSSKNKDDSKLKLPKNQSPIPGVAGAKWVTSLVVRLEESDTPQILFVNKGRPLKIAVFVNANDAFAGDPTSPPTAAPGTIAVWTESTSHGSTNHSVAWAGANNPTNSAIVTIVHNGTISANSEFRVNGVRAGAAIQFDHDACINNASGGETYVGQNTRENGPNVFDGYGVKGFTGEGFSGGIGEWITVLGDTTTSPHDTVLDTATTGEVQKIEGYLAHKYGLQHLLPAGHDYYASPPSGGAWTGTQLSNESTLALRAESNIVAKYRAGGGELAWAYNDYIGSGSAIACGPKDEVYTMGGRTIDVTTGEAVFLGNAAAFGIDTAPLIRKTLDDGIRAVTGVAASSTLTISGQPQDGDTVTIDGEVYTFRATLAPGATIFNVAIGALASDSLLNLVAAVNSNGRPGEQYGDGTSLGDQAANHLGYMEATGTTTAVLYTHIRGSAADGAVLSTNVTGGATWTWSGNTAGGDAQGTWSFNVGPGIFWWPFTWGNLDTLSQLSVDEDGGVYAAHPSAKDDDDQPAPYVSTGGISKLLPEGAADGTQSQAWYWNLGYTEGSGGLARPYNGFAFSVSRPYGTQDIVGPEHLYVATTGYKQDISWSESLAEYNLHKLRLVDAARSSETSARGFRRAVAAGGDLLTWEPGDSAFSTPTNGAGSLDASSRRVVGAELYGKAYICDGVNQIVLDGGTNRVVDWIAKKGQVPARIEQLARWRSRLVAVSGDDPHNWKMSRLGDPLDWDEYPEVLTAEQPISGNNPASLGRLAEPIQALIPYNDDVLVIGCSNSVHIMRGDPMAVALGGYGSKVIGIVTDEQGVAPGSAWTKDPAGNLYMLGSRGALLRMPPGGGTPVDLSNNRVRRSLESIDWNVYYAVMSWNYVDRGLHIFLMPWGASGATREHWFWEEATGAWRDGGYGSFWNDTYAYQPSAVAHFDADNPDSRSLVIGGEDGYLRYWDSQSKSDDGSRIYSRVLMGPYAFDNFNEVRVTRLEVTLSERAGCNYRLYGGDTPDVPTLAVSAGELNPGLNLLPVRMRASYVWLELSNGAETEAFSVENVRVRVAPSGRRGS